MFSCRKTHLKNFIKNCYKDIYKKCDIQSISTDIREWKPTIGLEIHAQILTKSKLFSGASTNFNCPINSSVSLFDCAIPGTMPAGFQITQQKKPLAVNGEIKFNVFKPEIHKQPYTKSSKIKQIQLEQDSGRSFHNEVSGRSLIDLNRAGIPLMELVFEPDLTNGEEAAALVKELCFILQLLGTCSCKMEEGALRVDANVSVNKSNTSLEAGGQVINETRAWNPIDKKTILMREKEEKHDYRFMPEPNLLPLYLHIDNTMENKYNLINVPSLKEQLPELPEQIRQKLQNSLTPHVFIAIMSDLELYLLFRNILNNGKHRKPQLVAQILISEVCAFIDEHKLNLAFCVCNQKYIEKTIDLLQARIINQHILRKLLNKLLSESNKMPEQIIEENNWFMISNEEKLELLCLKVLETNPKWVKKYKRGNKKIFKKFLHEVVTLTEGCAEMVKVSKIMTRLLS